MMAAFWRPLLARLWHEDEGLLTFEYIMLNTALVLGTVGAVTGIRDSINTEATGLSQSIRSLDQMRPALPSAPGNSQTGSANSAAQPSSHGDQIPLVGNSSGAAATNASSATGSNATSHGGAHSSWSRR